MLRYNIVITPEQVNLFRANNNIFAFYIDETVSKMEAHNWLVLCAVIKQGRCIEVDNVLKVKSSLWHLQLIA